MSPEIRKGLIASAYFQAGVIFALILTHFIK